jgi:hypothetical protein
MTQRWFISLGVSFSLVLSVSAALLGCEQGAEGDRCNPDLVDTTECNSGMSCVTPSSCVVSVCCPAAPPYSDPQCECFAHPEGCACNVDAAYDTGASADAGVNSGKDATHE